MGPEGAQASPRAAARVAGLAYWGMVVGGILWWVLIGSRVLVAGDPAATARAVLASEGRFRLGLLCELLMALNQVALALSHRALTRPAGRTVAAVATWLVLLDAVLAVALVLLSFLGLHLLLARGSLASLGPDQLADLVGLGLGVRMAGYTLAGVFLHLGMLLFSLLFLRSRLVPRPLAVLGVVAFALVLAAEVANLAVPGAPADLMTSFGPLGTATIGPSILAELLAGGWLLVRGVAEGPGAPGRPPASALALQG